MGESYTVVSILAAITMPIENVILLHLVQLSIISSGTDNTYGNIIMHRAPVSFYYIMPSDKDLDGALHDTWQCQDKSILYRYIAHISHSSITWQLKVTMSHTKHLTHTI